MRILEGNFEGKLSNLKQDYENNWERQYNKRMLKAYLKGHEYSVHGKTKEGYPNYFKVLEYKEVNKKYGNN